MARRRKRLSNKENKPPKSKRTSPFKRRKLRLWTNESMVRAMEAIKSGKMGCNRAALDSKLEYGVPRTTLKDRLSGRVVHGSNIGSPPYLTKEEEKELVDFLIKCSKLGCGKTRREVYMYTQIHHMTKHSPLVQITQLSPLFSHHCRPQVSLPSPLLGHRVSLTLLSHHCRPPVSLPSPLLDHRVSLTLLSHHCRPPVSLPSPLLGHWVSLTLLSHYCLPPVSLPSPLLGHRVSLTLLSHHCLPPVSLPSPLLGHRVSLTLLSHHCPPSVSLPSPLLVSTYKVLCILIVEGISCVRYFYFDRSA